MLECRHLCVHAITKDHTDRIRSFVIDELRAFIRSLRSRFGQLYIRHVIDELNFNSSIT